MSELELNLPRSLTRRYLLGQAGGGLGMAALSALLQSEGSAEAPRSQSSLTSTPNAQRSTPHTHFPARAKHVIYLHMIGAPSHLDLFDPKPELVKRDGQTCPEELTKGKRFAFIGGPLSLAGTKFKFARHGKCGHEVSELLPNLGRVADEIAVVRSLHTDEINHAPAQMFLHSGFGRGGRPSFGSWLVYGLASENRDLPAYVVLLSGPTGGAGHSLWSSGFLPSVHQGIQFRTSGDPVLFLSDPKGYRTEDRRRVLDAIQELNRAQLGVVGDPEIATRISQYELSFRMQASVPGLMDLSREHPRTLEMYGAEPGKASFANNCLLARRLVEQGVRFVQLFDADWDHHGGLERSLPVKCKQVDQPMAALIADLKQRGMLEDTLVIWGSEFGRTPLRQGQNGDGETTAPGRDHHKDAYSIWMAGGGIKPGISYGKTDDFGFNVVENPVHVHDLNATLLHLLGLNHERLTYRYQGRDFRLTDVHGRVVHDLLT